jgi:hypothetical protein
VGYAFAVQDAAEDRVEAVQIGVSDGVAPAYAAVYAPYHTPQRLVSHGIAGSIMLRAGNAITLRANGSWGFHAREDAPYFVAADTLPDSPAVRGTWRRAFHPSELRIGTDVRLGAGATLFAEASHRETAFYRVSSARAGVFLRFQPRVR